MGGEQRSKLPLRLVRRSGSPVQDEIGRGGTHVMMPWTLQYRRLSFSPSIWGIRDRIVCSRLAVNLSTFS